MTTADDAVAILRGLLDGDPWPPPGVDDTPANRQLRADVAQAIDALPDGVIPEIPAEWPDDEPEPGPAPAAAFDERLHPRRHAGEHGGGQFTDTPGGELFGLHRHHAPARPGTPEPGPEPAAVPAVPAGPGTIALADDDMARQYLADPAVAAAAQAEVRHGLDNQERIAPGFASHLAVVLGNPHGTSKSKTLGVTVLPPAHGTRPGKLTLDQLLHEAEEAQHGGDYREGITIAPWITDAVSGPDAEAEMHEAQAKGWWVPSGPEHNLTGTTVAHEAGHVAATQVPEHDMYSMRLWGGVAAAAGLPAPQVFSGTGDDAVVSPHKWLADNRPAIAKAVSAYGAKSFGELQAELWSEYTTNARPRPAAKAYGDFVRPYLTGKAAP